MEFRFPSTIANFLSGESYVIPLNNFGPFVSPQGPATVLSRFAGKQLPHPSLRHPGGLALLKYPDESVMPLGGYPVPDDKSEVWPAHIGFGLAVTGVGLNLG